MGQHRTNPNVKYAQEGKLPPREPKIGKREMERLVMEAVVHKLQRDMFEAVQKTIEKDETK